MTAEPAPVRARVSPVGGRWVVEVAGHVPATFRTLAGAVGAAQQLGAVEVAVDLPAEVVEALSARGEHLAAAEAASSAAADATRRAVAALVAAGLSIRDTALALEMAGVSLSRSRVHQLAHGA